ADGGKWLRTLRLAGFQETSDQVAEFVVVKEAPKRGFLEERGHLSASVQDGGKVEKSETHPRLGFAKLSGGFLHTVSDINRQDRRPFLKSSGQEGGIQLFGLRDESLPVFFHDFHCQIFDLANENHGGQSCEGTVPMPFFAEGRDRIFGGFHDFKSK